MAQGKRTSTDLPGTALESTRALGLPALYDAPVTMQQPAEPAS